MVWPSGWVCQAVLAPGVKRTIAAFTRDGGDGVATVSMKTVPVNQSPGPGLVSREFLVICMVLLGRAGWAGAAPRTSTPTARSCKLVPTPLDPTTRTRYGASHPLAPTDAGMSTGLPTRPGPAAATCCAPSVGLDPALDAAR